MAPWAECPPPPPLEIVLIAIPTPRGVASKKLGHEALGTSLVHGWQLVHTSSHLSPELIPISSPPTGSPINLNF